MSFIGNKAVVALFVKELIQNLKHDYAWTMSIQSLAKSEDCYVDIAISSLYHDTVKAVAANFSGGLTSI